MQALSEAKKSSGLFSVIDFNIKQKWFNSSLIRQRQKLLVRISVRFTIVEKMDRDRIPASNKPEVLLFLVGSCSSQGDAIRLIQVTMTEVMSEMNANINAESTIIYA